MSNADTKTRKKLSVVEPGFWRNKFYSLRDVVFAEGTIYKAGYWFAEMKWPSREIAEAVATKHMLVFADWVQAHGITYLGPVFFPADKGNGA
jgi:hypothetical protein